eukprot:8905067-Lingulodinium_polyedra.AAC.1
MRAPEGGRPQLAPARVRRHGHGGRSADRQGRRGADEAVQANDCGLLAAPPAAVGAQTRRRRPGAGR